MTDQPTKATLADGGDEWRLPSGQWHRVHGPAITYPDGTDFWYQHGERHRVDGPAITSPDGYEAWWQQGKLHRVGGPAVTYLDGDREWWINDIQVTEFEHAVVARAHTITEQGHTPELPQS